MHSESEIRPLREEDIPAVLALSKKRIRHGFLDEKGLRDYLDSPLLKGLVLAGESVQGYLLYRVGVEEGEIDEIAIEETIEGTGSGARLLASCLALLAEEGKTCCLLEVREKNERARRLYEKTGFCPYRRRKAYYGEEDAICYRKELLK